MIYFLREKNDKRIIILSSRGDHNFKFLNSLSSNEIKILVNPAISDLVNVIINAKLFIGVDSFPIHLADAYNSSFLGIFGPTNSFSVLINHNKSIQFKTNSLENIANQELLEVIKNKINWEKLN